MFPVFLKLDLYMLKIKELAVGNVIGLSLVVVMKNVAYC